MNRTTIIALALSATAVVGGAAIGHARMPADLATAHTVRMVHPGPASGSERPTTAEAEAYYRSHLGPSAAWRHATSAERSHARHEYVVAWEGGTEGCQADLVHAYQGTTHDTTWMQPGLTASTADHSDMLLAEYTDGICGD